ncbi:MAG: hypothetical protein U5O15_00615 [Candidatus Krumholzibacteriota bacterium]|nr:hypothetical protein [Candidatus Krumholzibacteriota bacterium]
MIFKNTKYTRGRTLALFLALFMLAMGLSACGDKTPSEKAKTAGEAVDDAMQKTGDAVGGAAKTTGDAVGDAMQKTGDAVGGAAKTTGDAVDDAMQATGEFLTQSKEKDLIAARKTVERIEKEWQELLAKSSPVGDAAQAEFQNTRYQMSDALADSRARLAEAKEASGDIWRKEAKPALEAALQKAQRIFEDASARFGDK